MQKKKRTVRSWRRDERSKEQKQSTATKALRLCNRCLPTRQAHGREGGAVGKGPVLDWSVSLRRQLVQRGWKQRLRRREGDGQVWVDEVLCFTYE